jgi:phosphonate transport system ATP-binding protein
VDFARQFADRIIGMKAGAVVFDGPPGELSQDKAAHLYSGTRSTEQHPAQHPAEPHVISFLQPSGALQ